MPGRRSEARRYAVLALYQWQVSGQPPAEIAGHFFDDPAWMEAVADGMANANQEQRPSSTATDHRPYDHQLFNNLLRGVPERADEIDDALRKNLDRSLQSLDPVERSILRIGTYELLFSLELPVRVIINEAVELAKAFGAEQGHRYVNAVLDRVARRVRASELSSKSSA
jgi:N utilization substance protein B